jgi:hypothetical protein
MTNYCYDKNEKRFGRGPYGILGVVPSPVEVTAVFPELSFTVMPHSQEIRFRRGDSFNIDVQVQDDQDPPSNVSIARSVLRFAARQQYAPSPQPSTRNRNLGATILKTSYDSNEIEFISENNGQARIYIKKSDTISHPSVMMHWDIELTKPIEHLTDQPGTVRVQYGDPIVAGLLTDFPTSIGLGDIIHVQNRYVMIIQRIDNRTLKVDYKDWTNEQNMSYNLYLAQSKTIASGKWNCLTDIIV